METPLQTPIEVATFLGVPESTLRRWRYLGIGPKFARVGKHVRYLEQDVLGWLRDQTEAAANE